MNEKRFTYDHSCVEYEADQQLDIAYSAVNEARKLFPLHSNNYEIFADILSRLDRASHRMASFYRIDIEHAV